MDTTEPITKKFVTVEYAGDPYSCAKSNQELLDKWMRYNHILKISIYSIWELTAGQTHQRIFIFDGSNIVDWCKGVPLAFYQYYPH